MVISERPAPAGLHSNLAMFSKWLEVVPIVSKDCLVLLSNYLNSAGLHQIIVFVSQDNHNFIFPILWRRTRKLNGSIQKFLIFNIHNTYSIRKTNFLIKYRKYLHCMQRKWLKLSAFCTKLFLILKYMYIYNNFHYLVKLQ